MRAKDLSRSFVKIQVSKECFIAFRATKAAGTVTVDELVVAYESYYGIDARVSPKIVDRAKRKAKVEINKRRKILKLR